MNDERADGSMPQWIVDVLDLVDEIPAGRVMSYGDIARALQVPSARQVGTVMAHHGDEVPWHRVVKSNGGVVPHQVERHLERLRAEGTPLRGQRVDMARARWHPTPE